MKDREIILSVSGGKDSTAMYLHAMRLGVEFRAVFADTDHEHDITYDYIRELPGKTGGPKIEWVKADFTDKFEKRRENIKKKWPADGVSPEVIERVCSLLKPSGNVFLDMCLLRGGFPGIRYRFCTENLKITPVRRQIYEPIIDAGKSIQAWNGVRADESVARACFKRMAHESWGKCGKYSVIIYRPILHWTVDDVLAEHKRHGIKPNPLYKMGATRVGCAPCIYARKAEVEMWARKFPERIDRLREWEEIMNAVSSKNHSTFFNANQLKVPAPIHYKTHGIDAKVKWACGVGQQEKLDIGDACNLPGYCE